MQGGIRMDTKKIIPCLDVKNGKVVKGVNFVGLKEVGDPVEFAKNYCEQGADELVFLDISATNENRGTMVEWVKKVADVVTIPFTVGGGIRSVEDMKTLLDAGCDKVSLNSAAIRNPQLLKEGADLFGKDAIVLAADGKMREDQSGWNVVINGGNVDSGKDLIEWVKEAEALGVGSILVTSMDADGTKEGYDIPMTKAVKDAVHVPVIASGGCGSLEDFASVFEQDAADAALAASMFHFNTVSVPQVKEYLTKKGIKVC